MMADGAYRILMAEDNAADVYLVNQALQLQRLDYHLETADNGEDMLNMIASIDRDLSQTCPDLFLVDLNLPKRPGDEILAHIRDSNRCSAVPVIVITSSDSPQDRARARELGASFYFRKPPDLERFMSIGQIVRDFLEPQRGVAP